MALARALAVRPQVLLLDEPLSALDAKVRVQLRDEIKRIQSEIGITALFVTHDQEEALAVADRVGVMRSGKLEQIGTPEEIYAKPLSGFVADFIGVTNELPGRVVGDTATVLGQRVPLLANSATGDVKVLVRPENIRLAADPQGDGEVVVVAFLGALSRVQVRLTDGSLINAQVSVSDASALEVGERVSVGLEPVPALAV